MSEVPFYNADLISKPAAVETLLAETARAGALLLACPEYNYSIAPVLKNALDWISREPDNREGGCPINEEDQCRRGNQATDGDFYNNHTVLMDNLNPHLRSTAQPIYTWEVTLPEVECDNCVLQIIQVMEDPAGRFHGVYNTTSGDNNDIYHQCIALRLRK